MKRIAATGLLLGVFTFFGAGRAGATPPDTGCPSGYRVLDVASLTEQGYQLPAIIDDPANGGNGNGLMCGLPLPPAVANAFGAPHQVYIFGDDNNPAKK